MAIFRLNWNQTEDRSVLNQSEHGNYNLIPVNSTRISNKLFWINTLKIVNSHEAPLTHDYNRVSDLKAEIVFTIKSLQAAIWVVFWTNKTPPSNLLRQVLCLSFILSYILDNYCLRKRFFCIVKLQLYSLTSEDICSCFSFFFLSFFFFLHVLHILWDIKEKGVFLSYLLNPSIMNESAVYDLVKQWSLSRECSEYLWE